MTQRANHPPPSAGTRYTHGHHESVLRSHRRRTAEDSAGYLLAHLQPGQRLLDVGSGPGTITGDLAGLVAPGEVVALEMSEAAVDLTRQELGRRGVTNASFVVDDVQALKAADSSFDVVHAHQVLQHVADPVKALMEMGRVARPGGLVAARDGDYAAFTWYPRVPALDAWMAMYQKAARVNGGEPDAGRRLLSWAQQAGFKHVVASSSTWCFATPEDRQWWGGMWADRILDSALADQVLSCGLATRDDLAMISRGWREWAQAPDGWLSILHGEILCRLPS